LRARREDAAAIAGLLNETSVAQYEGETLRARVERLIGQADEESKRTLEALQRLGGARADLAQAKTRAEAAEAELAALRAPVDVEKTLRRLARDIEAIVLESGVTSEVLSLIEGWLRPFVERAARLAREAEGLRAENAGLRAEVTDNHASARAAMRDQQHTIEALRAELAKVVLERDAMAERLRAELEAARDPVDGPEAKLAERTAEIERLRADIAHETARRDDQIAQLERRLGELAQGNEEAALQWREVARARTEALDTCRAATPQWARFREQFAGLLEVDYQARHLSEDAGDEGVDIRVARRDFEALQAALDFVDPDEGHDCATRASLWSLFDVCATEVADIAALLTLAGIASEDRLPLRVARAITEREAAAHQAAGLQVALTAAIDELQKGSES
jgi:chromosome segregation ATPase